MLVAAFVAAVAICAVPADAETVAGGANNLVLVQATNAGATMARAGTKVSIAASDTVASGNLAIALNADCDGCHSTAVAVQVLITTSNPSVFVPQNSAVAVNGGCNGCGAFAYARQYVLQTDGPAHLSGEGYQRVAQLRQEISDAAGSILPSDALTDPCPVFPIDPTCPSRDAQLKDKLDALVAQLEAVVAADVQAVGPPATTAEVQESPGP
jgi:Fe-S cluster biogenesis protein NfuA